MRKKYQYLKYENQLNYSSKRNIKDEQSAITDQKHNYKQIYEQLVKLKSQIRAFVAESNIKPHRFEIIGIIISLCQQFKKIDRQNSKMKVKINCFEEQLQIVQKKQYAGNSKKSKQILALDDQLIQKQEQLKMIKQTFLITGQQVQQKFKIKQNLTNEINQKNKCLIQLSDQIAAKYTKLNQLQKKLNLSKASTQIPRENIRAQTSKIKSNILNEEEEDYANQQQRYIQLKQFKNIQLKNIKVKQSFNNLNLNHHLFHKYFSGDLLADDVGSKKYLAQLMEQQAKIKIKRTRLIYKMDLLNKTNFHNYFDGHQHILIIIKTKNDQLLGAYSEGSFLQKKISKQKGLIFSITNKKHFNLAQKDFKAILYDEYYMIFGNSEIRIKTGQNKLYSNFGIYSGFYESEGYKVDYLLGQGDKRQVQMDSYQIYELEFCDY